MFLGFVCVLFFERLIFFCDFFCGVGDFVFLRETACGRCLLWLELILCMRTVLLFVLAVLLYAGGSDFMRFSFNAVMLFLYVVLMLIFCARGWECSSLPVKPRG